MRKIDIIKLNVKGTPGVRFIAEAGFDSEFHTQEAWDNMLKQLNSNPDINVVVVDGAVSRLDRPEFLSSGTADKLLTYWTIPRVTAENISEEIKNSEQYKEMMATQIKILEDRLAELKKKCPQTAVILSGHSDALQFSFTAMLNEILIVKQETISEKLRGLNARISLNKNDCRQCKKDLAGAKGKLNQRRLQKKLAEAGARVEKDKAEREEVYQEQRIYRVKKVRPMHQVETRELEEAINAQYRAVCDKLGVSYISAPTLIVIENTETKNYLVVDYTHSDHYTWGVLKEGDKKWFKGFHGKMARYLANMRQALDGKNVDVVVQSHHGSAFKRTQRTKYQPDSLNFTDINKIDSGVTEEYLTFVSLPTFEDQRKVAEFLRGKRADRLGSSGKPMSTRTNPAVDRYRNGGNTGICDLTKTSLGLGIQMIAYKKFLSGSILAPRKSYYAIICSSDEHIGHPAQDALARLGLLVIYRELSQNDLLFRGKKMRACGYINAGDLGEANSESWKHRPDHKLSANQALQKAIGLCAGKPKNQEELLKQVLETAALAMSGSVENMGDVLEAVAEYLMPFLTLGLEHSTLKYVFCAVPGNHIAGTLARHGIKEFFAFEQKVKQMDIGIFEVGRSGESDTNTDPNVRVALGGYEVSLTLELSQYGLSKDNEPMFGPIGLFVAHDPKGEEETGLVGALRQSNADLAIAGHTHEEWIELSNVEDNSWGVALRVPTMQKITATEIKYAKSPPRTNGAVIIVMPEPGDFSEFFLDANFLRNLGMKEIKKMIEAASEKPKK
jgi:hypothetical protein